MSNTIDGAVVDFLEEIPIDEIIEEHTKIIVSQFREGTIGVSKAIALLNEDCLEELNDYVETNKLLSEVFQNE